MTLNYFIKIKIFYFLDNHSLTFSGGIIDSTKIYAPVLGLLTIFIAFDNLLEPVCKDATDFFATT